MTLAEGAASLGLKVSSLKTEIRMDMPPRLLDFSCGPCRASCAGAPLPSFRHA